MLHGIEMKNSSLDISVGLKSISWKESQTIPTDEMSIELVGSTHASIDRVASKLEAILSTSQLSKQEP